MTDERADFNNYFSIHLQVKDKNHNEYFHKHTFIGLLPGRTLDEVPGPLRDIISSKVRAFLYSLGNNIFESIERIPLKDNEENAEGWSIPPQDLCALKDIVDLAMDVISEINPSARRAVYGAEEELASKLRNIIIPKLELSRRK